MLGYSLLNAECDARCSRLSVDAREDGDDEERGR